MYLDKIKLAIDNERRTHGPSNFLLLFDKSKDSKELYGMELHRTIDRQATSSVRLKLCRNYFNGGFQHMSIHLTIRNE